MSANPADDERMPLITVSVRERGGSAPRAPTKKAKRELQKTHAEEDVDGHGRRRAKFWISMVAYGAILFAFAINGTMLSTTYGAIATTIHAEDIAATWLNASYMIASSCANPTMGRLSTLFNPISLFLTCTALFSLGGLLTGLAHNGTMFMAARVITGVGAGGLFTTIQVLLVQSASPKQRALLIGVVNAIVTLGSSLGGIIGGLFVGSKYGWRPAFIFQVPLTLVASICVYACSSSSDTKTKAADAPLEERLAKVDYLGIITLSASLILLISTAMASTFSLATLLLGALFLALFVLVETHFSLLPLMPISVLLHPPTLFSCLATLFTMTSRWTVLMYAPIWSLAVLGMHPARAGASLVPTSIGFAAGGLGAGAWGITHAGGYYGESLATLFSFLSTFALFHALPFPAPTAVYVLLLFFNGLFTGACLNYTLAHVLHTTEEKAIVAGLFSTFRGLSPALGAGIAGGILQRSLDSSLTSGFLEYRGDSTLRQEDIETIQHLKGSPALVYQLGEDWKRRIAVLAYEESIRTIFNVAIAGSIIAIILQALTGIGKAGSEKHGTLPAGQAGVQEEEEEAEAERLLTEEHV